MMKTRSILRVVILLIASMSLVKLAPIASTSSDDIHLIEKCKFEKNIWKANGSHICNYIVHPSLGISLSTNADRLQSLRTLYQKYLAAIDSDHQVLRVCYLEGNNFTVCKGKVLQQFQMLGQTEQSTGRLQVLWDRFKVIDEELVWHCFWFHQADDYIRCNGISTNRRTNETSERSRHLATAWKAAEAALAEHIARAKASNETLWAQVDYCLYNLEWTAKKFDACYFISGRKQYFVYLSTAERIRTETMKQMYRQTKLVDKVADCFQHHRLDFSEFDGCEKISWNFEDEDGLSGNYVPNDAQYRTVWMHLEEQQRQGQLEKNKVA